MQGIVSMLDAQTTAQTQTQTLTNSFFNNNNNNSSSSCWVARAVYGAENPRWRLFRYWLLHHAPAWFRSGYLRHGPRVARWLDRLPALKPVVRYWMDRRIARLGFSLPVPATPFFP